MGEIVDLKRTPPVDDQELVADLCRFSEGLLTEKQVKKKHRLAESDWERLGSDEGNELVEKIEAEKLRRIRDGSTKREKSQALITKAPDILDSIASDSSASPRHRVDAIRTLDGMAANGSAAAAGQSDRYVIQINIGDTSLTFDKSRTPDPTNSDPFHPDDTSDIDITPWEMLAANRRKDDGGGQGHI